MFCSFVISMRVVVHTGKDIRCGSTIVHVYVHAIRRKDLIPVELHVNIHTITLNTFP
jgi:hypothetical protein